MTSVLLQPGVDGLDSIHLSKLLDWTPIAQAGYPWCSVYIGGNYGIIKAAIEAAWRAGIVLNPNFERLPDAAKRGYSEGVRHAKLAVSQLIDLGFLGEAPVIFSGSDTGFTDAELPAAMDYHRALVDTLLPIGWTGGAYGLRKVMEKLAQQPWWPSDWPIWHWGGDGYNVYWWAWVKQWYGHKPIGMPEPYDERHDVSGIPFAIDENTLFKPMKFWSGYGHDPINPQEDDMTPEECKAIIHELIDPQFKAVWDVLTQPVAGIPTDLGMQWNLILLRDHIVDKDHLVNRIVAATVAAYPPGSEGDGDPVDVNAIAVAVREQLRIDPLK